MAISKEVAAAVPTAVHASVRAAVAEAVRHEMGLVGGPRQHEQREEQ